MYKVREYKIFGHAYICIYIQNTIGQYLHSLNKPNQHLNHIFFCYSINKNKKHSTEKAPEQDSAPGKGSILSDTKKKTNKKKKKTINKI